MYKIRYYIGKLISLEIPQSRSASFVNLLGNADVIRDFFLVDFRIFFGKIRPNKIGVLLEFRGLCVCVFIWRHGVL